MDARDEIKQRLSVEEVVGDYLQLKRAGRNFKALSPFTNEKTASFMVSPEKQIWHDFSSNKGGDMFTFVMEMEGVDFVGAMEILARRANVDLSQYGRGDGTSRKKKDRIIEAHELALKYYHATLSKNRTALDYLRKERKYTKDIISEFGLGFAPSKGDALVTFLRKKKFTNNELKDTGLTTTWKGQTRDMFRGRIMIPLRDGQGRVIGFTGRIMDDGQPKYLNTPATLIYDKSGHVFGYSFAKESIREQNFVVVVEGNMDVVAAHMSGTTNVVATAGTAMTKRHMVQLQRLTQDVRLAFDNDKAGLTATLRAIEVAQESGVSISVINLPGGKDPDDLIKSNPAQWKKAIKSSQYAVDWVIEKLAQAFDVTSAEGKKKFSDAALKVISRLTDEVERDHYLQVVAKRLKVSKEAMRTKLSKVENNQKQVKRQPKKAEGDVEIPISTYQDLILGMMMRYPEVRDSLTSVEPAHFSQDWQKATLKYLEKAERKPIVKVPRGLLKHETYVNISLFRTEELYGSWGSSDLMDEAIGLARRLLNDYKKNHKKQLVREIADAETSGDDTERIKLLTQFNLLIKGEKNARNEEKEAG